MPGYRHVCSWPFHGMEACDAMTSEVRDSSGLPLLAQASEHVIRHLVPWRRMVNKFA